MSQQMVKNTEKRAKLLSLPLEAEREILKPLPINLIKELKAGFGKSFRYVSGYTVVEILNKAFKRNWDFEPLQHWIDQGIEITVKNPNKKNADDPDFITKKTQPIAHVKGRLTVRFYSEDGHLCEIVKTAYGAQIVHGEGVAEHIYKSASTDAMKKAASLLGVAQELYHQIDESVIVAGLHKEAFYVLIWSDDEYSEMIKYNNELEELRNSYKMTEEQYEKIIQSYFKDNSMNKFDILPTNVESFLAYIKKGLAAKSKQGQISNELPPALQAS